jgi:perosamine synthetase
MSIAQTAFVNLPSDQEASGRRLGDEEIAALTEAIRSGILTSTKGTCVQTFEKRFAAELGVKHAYACSSGTAAVHVAIAALNPNPGDEIITSSITDMGALTPIMYQGAVPVFAEVDPRTCNITAESIAARISPRTRAIILTHLFGNPCDMQPILDLAAKHGIPVIEDCAQSFLSKANGKNVGTLGTIGAFSLQQGKHITTGEGGIVTTDDDALARRMFLAINKAWGYGDAQPDHYFMALNYRMSELQGAVAVAQLPKLAGCVQSRVEMANMLTAALKGVQGIEAPYIYPGNTHTYWKYCVRVDESVTPGGAVGLGKALKVRGISCAPRYIQKPAFMCEVFQKKNTLGDSHFPFNLARPEAANYDPANYPQTFLALRDLLVLPWNENYTKQHVQFIADSIIESVQEK